MAKAGDQERRAPRLLVVDAWLPVPDRDAASHRMWQLLRVFRRLADLGALLDRSVASVAPLRFGAGVKGKVLTSMAHGPPVVASSIAIEGIPAEDGREVLVADDPDAIARKIVELHRDEGLWSVLSRNGLGPVERSYSPAVARDAVLAVLRRLDVKP